MPVYDLHFRAILLSIAAPLAQLIVGPALQSLYTSEGLRDLHIIIASSAV